MDSAEFLGEFTRYRVTVGHGDGAQALWADRPHRAGLPRWAGGAAVSVGLDPSQLKLWAL